MQIYYYLYWIVTESFSLFSEKFDVRSHRWNCAELQESLGDISKRDWMNRPSWFSIDTNFSRCKAISMVNVKALTVPSQHNVKLKAPCIKRECFVYRVRMTFSRIEFRARAECRLFQLLFKKMHIWSVGGGYNISNQVNLQVNCGRWDFNMLYLCVLSRMRNRKGLCCAYGRESLATIQEDSGCERDLQPVCCN